MCCFYLSSNICSFSTQNINFYIDFPYSIVKDQFCLHLCKLVGLDGLEPSTSRLSGARSNHLSYRPLFLASFGIRSTITSVSRLVEMKGIEPLTPCLQGRCSPS